MNWYNAWHITSAKCFCLKDRYTHILKHTEEEFEWEFKRTKETCTVWFYFCKVCESRIVRKLRNTLLGCLVLRYLEQTRKRKEKKERQTERKKKRKSSVLRLGTPLRLFFIQVAPPTSSANEKGKQLLLPPVLEAKYFQDLGGKWGTNISVGAERHPKF